MMEIENKKQKAINQIRENLDKVSDSVDELYSQIVSEVRVEMGLDLKEYDDSIRQASEIFRLVNDEVATSLILKHFPVKIKKWFSIRVSGRRTTELGSIQIYFDLEKSVFCKEFSLFEVIQELRKFKIEGTEELEFVRCILRN